MTEERLALAELLEKAGEGDFVDAAKTASVSPELALFISSSEAPDFRSSSKTSSRNFSLSGDKRPRVIRVATISALSTYPTFARSSPAVSSPGLRF
jgi:hypothetical protein